MSKTHISRILFATLHQKIVEVCYPEEEQRTDMWKRNEADFYGMDYHLKEGSIRDKMQKKLGKGITPRALYNLKNIYNRQEKTIPISNKFYDTCLEFINLSPADLNSQAQVYRASISPFPPQKIRPNRFHKNQSSPGISFLDIEEEQPNLINLCNSPWWFYFYEYQDKKERKVIRLVLRFKKENEGQYSIQLKNSGPPFTDFYGFVTHATDENIVCSLMGKKKAMTIMFTVDETGTMDLYPAIYLKHDSNHQLHSGSAWIHRIDASVERPLRARVFKQDSAEIEAIPKSIADFLYDMQLVYINMPRRFSEESLAKLLIKEKEARNEIKDIDLLISATILSSKEKKEFLDNVNLETQAIIRDFFMTNLSLDINEGLFEPLFAQISAAQELDVTNQLPKEGAFSNYHLFNDEVKKMIKVLSSEIEELDEQRIRYTFSNLPSDGNLHQEPKHVLKRDLELLKRCKAYMIICPYNRVFSSSWVLVGAAINLEIPTFFVYKHEENLPYVLRDAQVLDYVHMKKLRQENLQNIPSWFKQSNYGPKYFK